MTSGRTAVSGEPVSSRVMRLPRRLGHFRDHLEAGLRQLDRGWNWEAVLKAYPGDRSSDSRVRSGDERSWVKTRMKLRLGQIEQIRALSERFRPDEKTSGVYGFPAGRPLPEYVVVAAALYYAEMDRLIPRPAGLVRDQETFSA